jgi:1,4-alpha-glucan branching enzyme
MQEVVWDDGCPAFEATVQLVVDRSQLDSGRWQQQQKQQFRWGVFLDSPAGSNIWGIATEVNDEFSSDRYRAFTLEEGNQGEDEEGEKEVIEEGSGKDDDDSAATGDDDEEEQKKKKNALRSPKSPTRQLQLEYHLTSGRRLGAQKFVSSGEGDSSDNPGSSRRKSASSPANRRALQIRFSVWAPNATKVEVVFGTKRSGYIDDQGGGIDPAMPVIPLARRGPEGIWDSDPSGYHFAAFEWRPYMFRLTNEQGEVRYRTDLYSRKQIGTGSTDPKGGPYKGTPARLDGAISCSVVVDPDVVSASLGATGPSGSRGRRSNSSRGKKRKTDAPVKGVSDSEFWEGEFQAGRPVPTRLEDIVIYELHVGSLGYGNAEPGDLSDAIQFLDHLTLLGVNAVELLPMSQYDGDVSWGYGDSHHFAIQSTAGGRDEYRMFVKECHRRGIAVIQDVVYNHFDLVADRDEWKFDSDSDDHNIYYWYEGVPSDYQFSAGGYLNNGSSGYTPRFCDEHVRSMFISSAVALVEECHVDGFRVDLTTAIHRDNTLNADGSSVGAANLFGAKFLREWSRTLKMVKPAIMLVAEDYSGWNKVIQLPDNGGLGFDATWYADFYHHLIGDGFLGPEYARLINTSGQGGDGVLAMDYFAGALVASGGRKVVYTETHDEAGNDAGTARTIAVAVNSAPLAAGSNRIFAEARCRFALGMSMLSAGTPLFFMAEEVGAQNPFIYGEGQFLSAREDIVGMREGEEGATLFRFYQDMIRFRMTHPTTRTHALRVIYTHDQNRVMAFVREEPGEQLLVVGSLANSAFADGYLIRGDPSSFPDGSWKEVFNSDSLSYGGENVGNFGSTISSSAGTIQMRIPACGFLILSKTS